jgi:prolyl 4-hydroxylase
MKNKKKFLPSVSLIAFGFGLFVIILVMIAIIAKAKKPTKNYNASSSIESFAFADGKNVCNQLFYFEMDNFLSHQQCDALVQDALRHKMVASEVGEENHELDTNVRKSKQIWFKNDANDVTAYIHNKVHELIKSSDIAACMTGIDPNVNFEDIQVVRYDEKGKYDPHFDGTECGDDIGVKCFVNQRIATVLIYLNDDFEGGETRFPNLGISIKPQKGKAVFFWVSDRKNRWVYEETLHGGDPVLKGQKWIATQWIRSA